MTDLMTDLIHILYVYIITYMYGFYVPGPENCSCTALINPPPPHTDSALLDPFIPEFITSRLTSYHLRLTVKPPRGEQGL